MSKKYKKEWEMNIGSEGRRGSIFMGIFLVGVGVVALLKSMMIPMPVWLYTWQMLLIALGFFIGLSHGFRRGGWFIPMLVGGIFLADEYFLQHQLRHHIWPVVLIVLGFLFMIKSRRRQHCRNRWMEKKRAAEAWRDRMRQETEDYNKDNYIDSTSFFSNTKKNILSKDFKGGDIVNILGGTELNLSQADINGKVVLEVTAIFGGAKLVVPSNWIVKAELTSIFGGIQDKRPLVPTVENPDKVLLLKGTVLFGGIEINSF